MLLAIQGAALLLSSSPPAARHVIHSAFDRPGHGKQLVNMQFLSHDLCICASFFLFFLPVFKVGYHMPIWFLEIDYFKIKEGAGYYRDSCESVKVGVK
jgi:hypothetical protein